MKKSVLINRVAQLLTVLSFSTFIGCSTSPTAPLERELPQNFCYLQDVDPSIPQEIRYFGNHNFVGKRVEGYLAGKCILTCPAASALSRVQKELRKYSLSLKVYDCYRPQKAVDSFFTWAKDIHDNEMKNEFYPNVDKTHLFRDGYIHKTSGHSRGSTVDLTLVPLPIPAQEEYPDFHKPEKLIACNSSAEARFKDNSLDFGTGFDCFDPLAHTANPDISASQKQNRLLLKSLMSKRGFKNLPEEWWHFTLRDEPFPNKYFNFEIK